MLDLGPAVAVVLAYPDELLGSWVLMNPYAHDALTERERQHALAMLGPGSPYDVSDPQRIAHAASYVRERLRDGDLVKARAAMTFEPGAVITLDRCRYTVARRRGRNVELRGERGGRVDLNPPILDGGTWVAYVGGLLARNAKTRTYRRAADGAFTRSH